MGAIQAQTELPLPADTVEVLEANWRYVQTPSVSSTLPVSNAEVPALFYDNQDLALHATSTALDNYFGWTYTDGLIITQVGFNAYAPSGSATYNLVLETSNDNITWNTAQTIPEVTLKDKEWYYFQVALTPGYVYYRLRETVATTFSSLANLGVKSIVFCVYPLPPGIVVFDRIVPVVIEREEAAVPYFTSSCSSDPE